MPGARPARTRARVAVQDAVVDVYRVDTFEYLYKTLQFRLASPLRVHVAHFDVDLP